MSSQTSSTDVINTIELVATYLYQVDGPIFMFIGTVGSILNLIVFTQKNLRKNPCSIYLIAYNLANLIYIYSSLLSLTLYVGYNMSLCRLRFYMVYLFNCLSPYYLILASIDRILVTSPNALTRQRSTCRLAYVCTITITIFWAFFHSHALITARIIQVGSNVSICFSEPGVYAVFLRYYSFIQQIAMISLIIICGWWPINSIRNNTRRIRAALIHSNGRTVAEGGAQSTASRDRQLILMLLMDILIYAVFSLAFVIFLMYLQITQNYMKNVEQIQVESIVTFICLFSASIPFCISCYGNVIVSKTFRKELKKALSWNRLFCIH